MSQEKSKNIKGATKSNASAAVKGQIVAAGLKLGDLARAARIAPSTLSLYISGQRSNYRMQIAIYETFCRLAGIAATRRGEQTFWGELLNRAA